MPRIEWLYTRADLDPTSRNLGEALDPAYNCLDRSATSHKIMKHQDLFRELQSQIDAPSEPLQDTVKRVTQLVWRTCAPDASPSKTLADAIERFHGSFALLCFFAGMDSPARTMAEARKEAREHLDALCKVCTQEALETVH